MKKLLCLMIVMILMSGCASVGESSNTKKEKASVNLNTTNDFNVNILVDNETGVNYFVISNKAITPRLNKDGTLYKER